VVLYSVLALEAFAFPGGLVDWLEEHNYSGWLAGPLALARVVDSASARCGVKQVGERLRQRFATLIGGTDP
jgi:hypothetical protein